MNTFSISANQLRSGDIVEYDHRWHRVASVVRRAGGAWPVATDGTGWAIALSDRPVRIRRD